MTLSDEIRQFIDKYAGVRPDYDPTSDPIEEKYTSPDAYEMLRAAEDLEAGRVYIPFSSWGSGGYKPYLSQEGRQLHEDLINKLVKLRNQNG